MSRSKRMRDKHTWSRRQMAAYLGVDRSTVQRLEAREEGDEPGAIKRLLDLLEANPSLMPADPQSEPVGAAS